MAFDINLLYSLKQAGFRIREVPTEWTDKSGSKVALFRTSLTMFLSVLRIRLIYCPCLQMAAPVPPFGRVGLQEVAGAAAVAWTGKGFD